MSKPFACKASPMSAVVTDPYNASVSPTFRLISRLSMAAEPFADRVGHFLFFGLDGVQLRPLALDLLLVPVGDEQRKLARQQIVARVAVGDLHDFAAASQVLHVLSKDNFHERPSTVTDRDRGDQLHCRLDADET